MVVPPEGLSCKFGRKAMKNYLSKLKIFLSVICTCFLAMPQLVNAASYRVVISDPGSTLNVRSGPSTSYSTVATLQPGQVVEITSTSGNWDKISSGWISLDYTGVATKISGTRLATDNVVLRQGPGTNYTKLLTIPKGAAVTAYYIYGNWTYVQHCDSHGILSKGWANNSYVK
jgi:uncharacterized protein YraI